MDHQEDNLTPGIQGKRNKFFEKGSSFAPAHREDIVGIDPILERLDPIVTWLNKSDSLEGTRLQPGLLFDGNPGTGKTLCSRYLATMTNARFVNVREWPTEGDGVQATDVKALFDMARSFYNKDAKPIIIFWDEFESYARERIGLSARDSGIVSQLTAELDGINGKAPGVLFIGCTNYKENIDRALLRAGRMGIHINFIAPDRPGKQTLLKHYLSKFNTANDIDYEAVSYFFEDHDTAAFIEEAVNKAWLHAKIVSLKNDTDAIITNNLLADVFLENLLGPPAPFLQVQDETEFHVAVHEIGHALIARLLDIPVRVITVRAGERSLGRTFTSTVNEKIRTVKDCESMVKILLGSIYAERLVGLPNLINSTNDIYRANELAHKLTGTMGVKAPPGSVEHLDFFSYDLKTRSAQGMSDGVKMLFDRRQMEIIQDSEVKVQRMLLQIGKDKVEELARRLSQDKVWTGKEFDRIASEILDG